MSGHVVTRGPIAGVLALDAGRATAALLVISGSAGKYVLLVDVADDLDLVVADWSGSGGPFLVARGGRVLVLALDLSGAGRGLGRGLRYGIAVPQQVVVLDFVDGVEASVAELAAVLSDLRGGAGQWARAGAAGPTWTASAMMMSSRSSAWSWSDGMCW